MTGQVAIRGNLIRLQQVAFSKTCLVFAISANVEPVTPLNPTSNETWVPYRKSGQGDVVLRDVVVGGKVAVVESSYSRKRQGTVIYVPFVSCAHWKPHNAHCLAPILLNCSLVLLCGRCIY